MSGYKVENRVSRATKLKPEWYKPYAEYVISKIDSTSLLNITDKINAVKGEISDDYYKKVLNPFNATDKKFTRWRSDMRNYDIMRDVIRRYMGEYSKQPFDFQVKANDPDVITRFNDAFNSKISDLAIQQYINTLNELGVTTGQSTQEVPDFQEFFDDFKSKYVDDVAAQGQDLLNAIIDWTESNLKYYKAFYDYIVLGQTYSYRDVRNGFIYKEVIDPLSYHPISNGESFIEDHNEGVRSFTVTMAQILENFSTILDENTLKRVRKLFDSYSSRSGRVDVPLHYFKSILDDNTYTTFINDKITASRIGGDAYRLTNKDDMIDCYHIVFTTEVKVFHLTYIDPVTNTIQQDLIEADTFQMDPLKGHLSVTPEWWNEVWEIYRFGNKWDDIYSQPRPIAYQRRDGNNPQKVKLPYNGICEIVPGTGFTFSIPDAVLPFQLARNIFAFYREKIISKNKDKILVVPKSLMGDDQEAEDKIYRLEANSVFEYDDSEDDSGQKGQSIRVVDGSLSQFVEHITNLMDNMKSEAWDAVDMNNQRYGNINSSAGKGTTQEAIIRSSMGSVIIFTMFEKYLEKEYTADLEYSKMAYIDGKRGSYSDQSGKTKFLDLDVEKHLLANYGIHVVSSVIENEKRNTLKDYMIARGDNFKLAFETIMGDNIASIKKAFNDYEEAERKYQASIANEKERIVSENDAANRENDEANRKLEMDIAMLKEEGDTQRAIIKANIDLLSVESNLVNTPDGSDTDIKGRIENQKIELQKLAQNNDMQKHRESIAVKREDMKSKERIAKENRNKHDVKK